MHRPTLTAVCLLLSSASYAADLPTSLAAFAAQQSGVCTEQGGAPRVGPAFATAVDLNGDGALDYIVDLAGIECANAWAAFCGPEGCPLSVWIGSADGPTQAWADVAQGWRLEGAETDVAVVVDRSGDACADGAVVCSETLAFEAPVAPAPAPPPTAPVSVVPLEAPVGEGWSLREVPDGPPIAISVGPGVFASVAVLCLAGQPVLAAPLDAGAAMEAADIGFAFAVERVAYAARPEAAVGGALAIALSDRTLLDLLSGRDSSVRLALDGADQGVLSLRGSTRAIRDVLARCTRD